jgi:lipoate-protein ligase A
MKWYFIDSGFGTGKYNMEFDISLAERCNSETAFFRIYRWKPYCISLGANQSSDDIDSIKTNADGIDVVKRPTGGRAILHAEEITYSVVYPINYDYSPKELYQKISSALIEGLAHYNPILKEAVLENIQPNFSKLLEEPSGALCFASTAKNEVKFKGRKLIGSAQRKMKKAILQHGSILCGSYHQNLANYLNTDDDTKNNMHNELKITTTEIESILNEPVNYEILKSCLADGFREYWGINFTSEFPNISIAQSNL